MTELLTSLLERLVTLKIQKAFIEAPSVPQKYAFLTYFNTHSLNPFKKYKLVNFSVRADAWPLMSSVWPTVAICVAYVYFVKVLGPR